MSPPLKVLFISRKWPPAVGGMETYSYELCRELTALVELKLCVLPGRTDGRTPTVGAMVWFGMTAAWRILRREHNHDIVHGGDIAVWPLAIIAKLSSPGGAIVLSAHGSDVSFGERPGLAAALYRIYLKIGVRLLRQAHVIANSSATVDHARDVGFSRIAIVPLASRPVGDRPPAIPKPYVLFVGRSLRQKGLRWFAEEVLPRLPDGLSLLVAGPIRAGPCHDRPATDRVRLLGPIRGQALTSLMADALCVILPNIPVGRGYFEGFGLVAVEAAAAGGVVLASRMDGFTDSVVQGETGFLLEPMAASDWARAISDIAAWPPVRRLAFTERSRAKAALVFSWERVARATFAIYEKASLKRG